LRGITSHEVTSPVRYIDAPVCRDEDKGGDSGWELSQTRTNNKANEITGLAEPESQTQWAQPVYDARGNPFDCVPVRRDSAQGKL